LRKKPTTHSQTILHVEFEFEFEFLCLTPLSAIYQLYHGDQF